jgi:hypothetical protein
VGCLPGAPGLRNARMPCWLALRAARLGLQAAAVRHDAKSYFGYYMEGGGREASDPEGCTEAPLSWMPRKDQSLKVSSTRRPKRGGCMLSQHNHSDRTTASRNENLLSRTQGWIKNTAQVGEDHGIGLAHLLGRGYMRCHAATGETVHTGKTQKGLR